MSGYVRDIVIKKDWDGDKVTVVMKPASFVDVLSLARYLKDGKVLVPIEELENVLGKLKGYTTSVTGLYTHDSKDVTVDELFGTSYFFGLAQEIMAEWVKVASPANPSSPGALPSA